MKVPITLLGVQVALPKEQLQSRKKKAHIIYIYLCEWDRVR